MNIFAILRYKGVNSKAQTSAYNRPIHESNNKERATLNRKQCKTDFYKLKPTIDNNNGQNEEPYGVNLLHKFLPNPIVNKVGISILLRKFGEYANKFLLSSLSLPKVATYTLSFLKEPIHLG